MFWSWLTLWVQPNNKPPCVLLVCVDCFWWMSVEEECWKLLCCTISHETTECVAFSPSRLHALHSPFNGLTSFQIAIINFSNLQSLFPAAFLQQMPRKTWQEKYTEWTIFPPSQRSTVCHYLMFIHPAKWKFQKGKKVKRSQTGWEHLAVSLCAWKMLGDFVKKLEKQQALQNTFLLLGFAHIALFCHDHLRPRQGPSCIRFSSKNVFLFAVRGQLLPVQLSKETASMFHLCWRRCTG